MKEAAEAVKIVEAVEEGGQSLIEFGIKDALDILLVASLLFYVYRLMKESRSLNIFVGIMLFVLIWLFVSQVLEIDLLGSTR